MELLAVFTTVADETQAQMLATVAVERRLAACVQTECIRSTYRWNGSIQQDGEFRLMFKTTAAKYRHLEELLIKLHPYDLPAIFAVPVSEASLAYANWVHESVEDPAAAGSAS